MPPRSSSTGRERPTLARFASSVRKMSAAKKSTTMMMAMGCTVKPKGTGQAHELEERQAHELGEQYAHGEAARDADDGVYSDSNTMMPAMLVLLMPSTL